MFTAAFLLGLSGSLHCAGMCGPICFIMMGNDNKNNMKGLVIYNSARILVYTLFGFLIGFLGASISFTSMFPYLIFGVALLLFWVGFFAFFKGNILDRIPIAENVMAFLRKVFKPFFAKRNWIGFAGMGVFNALIPCGILYTALLSSISMGSVQNSTLFMLFFGLGTAPSMLSSQYILGFLKRESYPFLKYLMPLTIIALSLFLMYRSGLIQELFFPTESVDVTECK